MNPRLILIPLLTLMIAAGALGVAAVVLRTPRQKT